MEKSAGIILFREKKGKREYLLLKHNCKTEYWNFPKGRMEKEEREEETALREAKEETGLKKIELVPGFKEIAKYFYKKEGKTIYKEVVWFLGKVLGGEGKVSREHLELKWCGYKGALERLGFKNSKRLLRKAEGKGKGL